MGGEPHDVDLEDEGDDQEEVEFGSPHTTRRGERRSIYLSRKDFERHGYSDGCVGCRAISSGKKGRTGVAHNRACRRRMEGIVRECDPTRWARHLRRNGDVKEGEATGGGSTPTSPARTGCNPKCRDSQRGILN